MMIVPASLLVGAAVLGLVPGAVPAIERAAALGASALGLFGRPLREALPPAVREPGRNGLRGLRHLHSGHIGDYIAWWSAGVSVLGGVCLVALR